MSREKALETVLVMSAGLFVLSWLLHIDALSWVSAALCLLGIFSPLLSALIAKAWLRLSDWISRITTPIILGLVFFIVLTPVAICFRIFSRKGRKADSTFVHRDHNYCPEDFINTW